MLKEKKNRKFIFILPSILFIIFLVYIPFIYSLIMSLYYGRGNNLKFSFFKNYSLLFNDDVFNKVILNSLTFTIIIVPIIILFSLYVSYILLNIKSEKTKNIFTTLLYIPCITSPVAYSLFFKQLAYNDGILSSIFNNFNILGNVWSARLYISLICIWAWSGYYILFLFTAIKNVDVNLYKAAKLDGASNFKIFRKIVIPLVKPVLILMTILVIIGTFQLFVESSLITKGGPSMGTYSIVHYLYNRAFVYVSQYGYASALGTLVFLFCLIVSIPFVKRMIKDENTL